MLEGEDTKGPMVKISLKATGSEGQQAMKLHLSHTVVPSKEGII